MCRLSTNRDSVFVCFECYAKKYLVNEKLKEIEFQKSLLEVPETFEQESFSGLFSGAFFGFRKVFLETSCNCICKDHRNEIKAPDPIVKDLISSKKIKTI